MSKLKRVGVILGWVVWMLSCDTQGESSKTNNPSGEYVGTWKRTKGEKTLTIFEKNDGLFLKYPNGGTYPLKFETEGRYYYAVTPLGHVPLLLDKGILTINNGYEFNYKRVE